jgi:hypothetical protein
MKRYIRNVLVLFAVLGFSGMDANARSFSLKTDTPSGDFDIRNASFLLPLRQTPGHYSSAIYLYQVVLPKDWTLDINKAPMFGYSGKYALPGGFNIQGNISTLFVSSRINMGPFWNKSVDRVHFGIGYQIAFNFGILKSFGYNTTLTGWEQQPSATIGYSFDKIAISVRTDMYWNMKFYLTSGENTIPSANSFLNGYSITTSLEQRLWKNRVMSFGLKWYYVRYHILAWPAFPVNKYYYNVPEFQIGLNF